MRFADAMVARLEKDTNFAHVKTTLEEFHETQPHIAFILCVEFWCDLQWVEQYWDDAKHTTRGLCDYTIAELQTQFPPPSRLSPPPTFATTCGAPSALCAPSANSAATAASPASPS